MQKRIRRGISKVLTCLLCTSAVVGNSSIAFADSSGFITEQVGSGYAISGITEQVIQNRGG